MVHSLCLIVLLNISINRKSLKGLIFLSSQLFFQTLRNTTKDFFFKSLDDYKLFLLN